MKRYGIIFLLFVTYSNAQEWQAEVMVGTAAYNGDLAQRSVSFNTMKPAVSLNFKREFYYLAVRAGLGWAQLSGDDRHSTDEGRRSRNLNFKTNILEASLVAEVNLAAPDMYFSYPYIFAGIGMFHFNPYTKDDQQKKYFLRPLSTEGQGLAEYPDRKKYNLTEVCIPFGAGWKVNLGKDFALAYELGYRLIFTDYLDDVSREYVSAKVLAAQRGPKAAELAMRATPVPSSHFLPSEGDIRGNPKENDGYFVNGFKLTYRFGHRD